MITVSENWDSREGTIRDGTATDLQYIIRGTDEDTAARDAVLANSPAFYNLARGHCQILGVMATALRRHVCGVTR